MSSYLKKLRDTVWRTSSARYHAARRLKRKELFSTISLAFFSALSIALSVIQQTYATEVVSTPGLNSYLTSISILSGIFILAISLMEWGSRNGANADALYKNAQELNALQQRVNLEISKAEPHTNEDWSIASKYLSEYEEIKNRCDANHSPLDDRHFVSQHRKSPEFTNNNIDKAEAFWISLLWHMSSIWYYLIFWTIMAISMIPVITSIKFVSSITCGTTAG